MSHKDVENKYLKDFKINFFFFFRIIYLHNILIIINFNILKYIRKTFKIIFFMFNRR